MNAADNFQRDRSMDTIRVDIDQERGRIRVWNNGKGIPVTIHKEQRCYVPEMIFGQLLTSSNYDDDQRKVTGGRNGFGAKLANIFSKTFIIETADSKHKKYYKQVFRNNMGERGEPELSPNLDKANHTCVTFYPDFSKFRMDRLDDDIIILMTKRVYDMAGVTDKKVNL